MSTESLLSVVLAGGGTAGHISPLLAIANALRQARPGVRLLAVGTPGGMEATLVPAAGLDLATISRVPFPRRPSLELLRLPARLAGAVKQAGAILDAAGADVLVGVGGYVCTPMYIAAWRRKIPIVIHEANTRPGLANRVGARLGGHVAVAFAGTKLGASQHVGMPMREEISGLDRSAARTAARVALGLEPDLPALVVTGGSSGAQSINRTIAASLGLLAGAGIQTLHITGRGKAVHDADGRPLVAPGYHQREYVDGMETVYAAADLLLARSGAATVSEAAAVGLPAVFVPLPIGNGEQALNAAGLVDAGGALLVADSTFSPDWVRDHIVPLLQDRDRLARMAASAEKLGIRDADRRMADLVLGSAAA
ncbi:undecaprenyldiphospho-muramoylpentapeptide beta-N-acetylglucosaminyltransferase [Arthrobacter sp. AL08]|uniref:undecaprenyldiphospho-muramoylpentapeptide beta-N-acetylglucosaminyltransferase n=1 Tax=Micrococcaceae TaxID=1268 RepID=UPI001CFFE7C9|nr:MULTISPECIES: undecaprenyldiphospho-muramoylpentapeptide beta-N-acetylglucosaminyltransferase [Micrococcaceae]MCB5281652.1 UDP-N-acetylglucosamine--N-acetylmuramyl-(pentapeptide) pyrophosphoryl-undecaprenol N-acetylglucosamine transferase [Arthrobacter sp. ES1]MDI3241677.1 undecaprenyldiphospho-muramoylpentapeptide beta-N-acetylglucosaminyltransferase [Arthrobacter sp. AL05]MDI3277687.1 undecaprenyldiphospho-muramoylpentapeptide beta-N-acetylglucosaminyltransferase [Arthrobacter sp. AL08]MDJ